MSVYNGEKYVAQAITSIINQTFQDWELLVINDGSTDKSFEIMNSFASQDKRVVVIDNGKNIGLTKSLNKGIIYSRGEYIARQDADDISLPERIAKQVDFMEKNKTVGCCGCDVIIVDDQGKQLKPVVLPAKINQLLPKRNVMVHGSLMFRREIILSAGCYDENFYYAQDYDLLLRLSKLTVIAKLADFCYHLRYGKNRLSSNKFWQQLYYTSLAKYYYKSQRRETNGILAKLFLFKEIFYSFFFIYKMGAGEILRLVNVIK